MGEAAHSVSEWAGQALTELPRWRRELIFIGEVSMAQVDPIWKFPKVTVRCRWYWIASRWCEVADLLGQGYGSLDIKPFDRDQNR